MPAEIIVGICRFSYLGRSDWVEFRRNKSTDEARLAEIATRLFDEERLTARFLAFETICLPSILEQRDPRFIFLLVSSPLMPEHWRKRLHALCDPHDQIQILWSDAPMLAEALEQPLRELYDLSDGNLWQFRLDDDDAIDAEFMLRLRRNMARMEGIDECVITAARGINIALYDNQPTRFLEFRQAFWGAGLAIKLKQPGLSIFRYGHFGLREQFTHFVDHEHYAALILKWESDSMPLNFNRLPAHVKLIDEGLFQRHLAAHFPFLEGVDFDILRRRKAPEDMITPPERPTPAVRAIKVTAPAADAIIAEMPDSDTAPGKDPGKTRNIGQEQGHKAQKNRNRDTEQGRSTDSHGDESQAPKNAQKDKPRGRNRNQHQPGNQGRDKKPEGEKTARKRPQPSE
ncbi:glycosyltransferase [Paracoccus sp. DMF-8]|uniref:glycosyltransferase n=1 Tax=Paracoccus sp. DMF-8 TaxID=3019445 RepID=UPI0023E4144A|nr:glycosyltransferase [Paracoccus sp. DMF-8]MDF3608403.1 glycosyltransferase [Paracoccus sp. DMF-8]